MKIKPFVQYPIAVSRENGTKTPGHMIPKILLLSLDQATFLNTLTKALITHLLQWNDCTRKTLI